MYWDKSLPQELIENGKYIHIKGSIKEFNGLNQLNIRQVQPFNGVPLNINDYISGQNDAVLDHYCTLFNGFLENLEDPSYRDLINYCCAKLGLVTKLRSSPYGLEGPMANKGGLLMHIVHHLQITISSCESFGENNDLRLNKSLLIVGCILRHLGWTTTTHIQGTGVEPLDSFYTITPQMESFRLVDQAIKGAEIDLQITIPEGNKQALLNLCLDKPVTIEGQLICQTNKTTDLLEVGHSTLMRSRNKNWIQDLFIGHEL